MRLLGQIAGFVVAAVALGFGLGFLTWRLGRRSMPTAEWAKQQRQLDQQASRIVELEQRLRGRGAETQDQPEWSGLAQLREAARVERDQLRARLELARSEAIQALQERDHLAEHLESLQRRLAELSVSQARGMALTLAPPRELADPRTSYLESLLARASSLTPPRPPETVSEPAGDGAAPGGQARPKGGSG